MNTHVLPGVAQVHYAQSCQGQSRFSLSVTELSVIVPVVSEKCERLQSVTGTTNRIASAS